MDKEGLGLFPLLEHLKAERYNLQLEQVLDEKFGKSNNFITLEI